MKEFTMEDAKSFSLKEKERHNELIKKLKEEPYKNCHSIDWLTINGTLMGNEIEPRIIISGIYTQKRECGSNVFAKIMDIFNATDELIGTIVYNPHSSILDKRFAQLQIANKWLYVGNLDKLLNKILFHSNFELTGISRLDFACDLYEFEKGLTPEKFIRDFANENVTKLNASKFTLWGKTNQYMRDYHQLSIGDHTSVFSWKLYNKSKELRECHDKPYIRYKWQKKLLNYDENKDVWRLEVSIKNWSKIKVEEKKLIQAKENIFDIINDFPAFFVAFCSKKFVFKDEFGKFIDFVKLPDGEEYYKNLSTNISTQMDFSPTYPQKCKIINSILAVIEKSQSNKEVDEYINKLYDFIQEEEYYLIMTKKGITPAILDSYYTNKFNKSLP